jgi:hypothetical protein
MSTDTAPQGDLDALLALNRDYIHSVQHGDVRRFDEILAEDFLCSNPDGSLVDKSAFLAQIGRPVTISGLTAQDVQVRIPSAFPKAKYSPPISSRTWCVTLASERNVSI